LYFAEVRKKMDFALKQLFIKYFLILMGFQILNQSVDTIEFIPIYSPDCVGDFNYINSGIEYCSEIILGNKNAFPEFQKENTSRQSQQNSKHVNIKVFQPIAFSIVPKPSITNILFAYPTDETHRFLFVKDVIPEPPKA